MNFRTSYLAGLVASLLAVSALPLTTDVRAAELKITGPDGQTNSSASRQYGPTLPQDTFWSIAKKFRPDSRVSIYQVMAAIYEANPRAFSGPNYNTLEKGVILIIPARDVIAAIPKAAAERQALEHDRAWRQGNVAATPRAKPLRSTQATPKPAPTVIKAIKPVVPAVAAITPAAEKALETEIKTLSQEVTNLKGQLDLKISDLSGLIERMKLLDDELQSSKEGMASLKLQNEQLQAENTALKEREALAQLEANKPTDIWRTLMANPLLLVGAGVVPSLLLLLLAVAVMRRRGLNTKTDKSSFVNVTSMTKDEPRLGVGAGAAAAGVAAAMDSALQAAPGSGLEKSQDVRIALSEDIASASPSAVDLNDNGVSASNNGAISSADDDGLSLDALWAEAMAEQDELLNVSAPAADTDTPSVTPASQQTFALNASDPEVIDSALLSPKAEDNLDALMAQWQLDADALKAQHSETVLPLSDASKQIIDESEPLNAVAATPLSPETVTSMDVAASVTTAQISELGAYNDNSLSALSISASDKPAGEHGGLSDAPDAALLKAAQLEPHIHSAEFELPEDILPASAELAEDLDEQLRQELDRELGIELSADFGVDTVGDEELMAMLAEFESNPIHKSASHNSMLAPEPELDAAVATTGELGAANDDLEALLASFNDPVDSPWANEENETANHNQDIAAGLGNELPVSEHDESLDALLAGLEPETAVAASTALAGAALAGAAVNQSKASGLASSHSDDADHFLADKSGLPNDAVAGMEASAAPATPSDPVAISAKDSGFFNDLLKGNRHNNVLEWESVPASSKSTTSSQSIEKPVAPVAESVSEPEFPSMVFDDAQLSSFARDDDDEVLLLDDGNDKNLTVDEALAALDASEKSRKSLILSDNELQHFQKDNEFIDIDKLLSDADNAEPESYPSLDMEIGMVESLLGDAAMVDVDDEENAVNAKLDLARAYIEIDDNDSARALLNEVTLDGNERQKAEAIALLADIS